MSEPSDGRNSGRNSGRTSTAQRHKSLIERLTAFIFREPENREQLLELLSEAHERDLLDADALSMIEGVLQVSELRARDLMVPILGRTTCERLIDSVYAIEDIADVRQLAALLRRP